MMENCIDLFVEENADSVKAIAESFSGNGEEAGDTAAGAMPESDGEEVEEVIEIATAEEQRVSETLLGPVFILRKRLKLTVPHMTSQLSL